MAYGTPSGPDDIERYYTDIRRGRPPAREQLASLQRRYDMIGGVSPLAQVTARQAAGLQTALEERAPGRYVVFQGNKHSPPSIPDAVAEMAAAGIRRAIGLVLAPHYSPLSTGDYAKRAAAAGREAGVEVDLVPSWHLAPGLVALLADRVREACDPWAPELVVFTAHSLPERAGGAPDPYPQQVAETAAAVGRLAGVRQWRVAWQSAARTGERWLGPSLLDTIEEAAGGGCSRMLVCPAGFTSDHLEVLYDIDIEARQLAASRGIALRRTASLNDDPRLMGTLAEVVELAAGPEGATPGAATPGARGPGAGRAPRAVASWPR